MIRSPCLRRWTLFAVILHQQQGDVNEKMRGFYAEFFVIHYKEGG